MAVALSCPSARMASTAQLNSRMLSSIYDAIRQSILYTSWKGENPKAVFIFVR